MRFIATFVILLLCPALVLAQGERQPPEIKKIHVGFQTYQNDMQTAYKVGLWTPIYVEVFGGTDGVLPRGGESPYLDVETVDSEGVGTRIRLGIKVKPNDTETALGYIKVGHKGGVNEIKVTLHTAGRDLPPRPLDHSSALEIDAHLYLTLGAKIADYHQAVLAIDRRPEEKGKIELAHDPTAFRHVVFENKVKRLPESWIGYNGVDMIVLATSNDKFLKELNNDARRLGALTQWLRRGGRLVVPIDHVNQPTLVELLKSPAWDPPIPVLPRGAAQGIALKSVNVAQWGAVQDHVFERADPRTQKITVAALDPGKVPPGDWTIFADSGPDSGNRPLIAQVRYGLGQITYLAFSFEDPHFFAWAGKEKFLQTMTHKLAPRTAGNVRDPFGMRQNDPNDLATQLLGDLDNFNVKVIPFGYVALFIVLYILVVGPLDFIILKYVLKRLEWTWITFPAVVLGVSVLAYVTAFALKGRELKVNKIDIVDFDLRTTADKGNVHAYGQSFFTILSPRIQNYTVGIEPNPAFWGGEVRQVKHKGEDVAEVLSADQLSWMGRPSGGPDAMGRSGSSSLFRKPYAFRDDAAAVEGVPIPVWTTKAFNASWEQTLKSPPFKIDLVYHTKEIQGKDLRIAGKIENHLGVDLIDVWLIYDNRAYPVPGTLKSMKRGGKEVAVNLVRPDEKDLAAWVNTPPANNDQTARLWTTDPTPLIKRILFHEAIDTRNAVRNHLLRPLDQGWRIQEEPREKQGEHRTREAMLFARVAHAAGQADEITSDANRPLATKLWLGDTPETGRSRPSLDGQLNQDTYVRVILPVRPAQE